MDLALDNVQRLICLKKPLTKQTDKQWSKTSNIQHKPEHVIRFC